MKPSKRKVVTRSPARTVRVINLRGRFPDPVECESSLERDFVLRAALHPAVVKIKHQPFELHPPGCKRYTPDYLLTLRSGQWLVVEVKPRSKIDQYRDIFDFATAEFGRRGVSYAVADELAIRRHLVHKRAATILRYRKVYFSTTDCGRALDVAAAYPQGLSLQCLAQTADVPDELLLHLMATGRLMPSQDLAIGANAQIRPVNPIEEYCHVDQLANWLGFEAWGTDH